MRIELMLAAVAAFAGVSGFAAETADPRVRTFIDPVRIVWKSQSTGFGDRCKVTGEEKLVTPKRGQIPEVQWGQAVGCRLENNGLPAGVLLDFGREIHGGVLLGFEGPIGHKVRLRFGESVAEAMSEIGERGATNDHAVRDQVLEIPHMGDLEYGNTGFRFLRIDLITPGRTTLEFAQAVSLMRPMKRHGAFVCSDERLNRIWETSVRTVHNCCQRYVWDGIKRDRLVWIGDLHPEMTVITSVFGDDPIVPESLVLRRTQTPPGEWMGLSSYNMWWIRCVRDWYFYTGDVAFLRDNAAYLRANEDLLTANVSPEGKCIAKARPFLDWPSLHNKPATDAGMQALITMAFRNAAEIESALGETARAEKMRALAARTAAYRVEPHACKQAAALLALHGFAEPRRMFDEVLGRGGVKDVSTFYGYYMLEAMCAAGERQFALDTVRDFWGAMLDMGATSFWENFDVAWTNNAFRIDELPVAGKKDVHGDYGEFCYPGFRHSLCHGWAGGPAAWCIGHVLGIRPLDPGCKTVEVKPFLGDLSWAEGALALPKGRSVRVRVEKRADGTLKTDVAAPPDVTIRR